MRRHTNIQVDYNGGANPIYIGEARGGTGTSAAAWTIAFCTWDGSNNLLTRKFAQAIPANGEPANTCIWDNRALYTYA